MGEKKEKKEKGMKWRPAHETLRELLGEIIHIQTIARAYAMGTAAPPEGIPGLIEVFESAGSTTIGQVGFIREDIKESIRNLKKQLAEAKAREERGEPLVELI